MISKTEILENIEKCKQYELYVGYKLGHDKHIPNPKRLNPFTIAKERFNGIKTKRDALNILSLIGSVYLDKTEKNLRFHLDFRNHKPNEQFLTYWKNTLKDLVAQAGFNGHKELGLIVVKMTDFDNLSNYKEIYDSIPFSHNSKLPTDETVTLWTQTALKPTEIIDIQLDNQK